MSNNIQLNEQRVHFKILLYILHINKMIEEFIKMLAIMLANYC